MYNMPKNRHNYMKTTQLFLILVLLSATLFANTPKNLEKNNVHENELMIGYYGRPYAKSLGVLGESNIDDLIKKIRKKCNEYTQINNSMTIIPTFHIIYGLAIKEEGRNGTYIKNLSDEVLMQYILAAQKENFAIILDVQLGSLTPLDAITPLLKYLKYENVHFALDPEFKIPAHKRYPPGKYIGHIYGKDVNDVQNAMNKYMIEHNIMGKRKLLVHMFHKKMLRQKEQIKSYENVELVFNIDGHGNAGTKVKIYNNLYDKDSSKIAHSGFKIFYNSDKGPLATPKQILGLENVGSRKIHTPPLYINYH